jgi:hypothetical protein
VVGDNMCDVELGRNAPDHVFRGSLPGTGERESEIASATNVRRRPLTSLSHLVKAKPLRGCSYDSRVFEREQALTSDEVQAPRMAAPAVWGLSVRPVLSRFYECRTTTAIARSQKQHLTPFLID